jgi:hypothetical protein
MTSILKVNQIQTTAGAVPTAGDLGLNVAGSVLQVVNTVKTDVFTTSLSSTRVPITGLSASITPSSTSSKILVMPTLMLSAVIASFYHFWLYRDGSIIQGATGDGSGSRTRDYGFHYTGVSASNIGQNMTLPQYLDSPATTSSTTYQIYTGDPNNAGNTLYLNQIARDSNAVYEPRCISSITLMEIAG